MAANLLIHIPHASLCLPPDFWRDVMVDRKIIEHNLRFMADYKADELAGDIDCHKIQPSIRGYIATLSGFGMTPMSRWRGWVWARYIRICRAVRSIAR